MDPRRARAPPWPESVAAMQIRRLDVLVGYFQENQKRSSPSLSFHVHTSGLITLLQQYRPCTLMSTGAQSLSHRIARIGDSLLTVGQPLQESNGILHYLLGKCVNNAKNNRIEVTKNRPENRVLQPIYIASRCIIS